MKYIVINAFVEGDAQKWMKRTICVNSIEPLTEPTEQERIVAEHERALDAVHGGPRRRRRPTGEPSIEAWDAGCRTLIYGGGEGYYLTAIPFEVLNNYLDAINLTELPNAG